MAPLPAGLKVGDIVQITGCHDSNGKVLPFTPHVGRVTEYNFWSAREAARVKVKPLDGFYGENWGHFLLKVVEPAVAATAKPLTRRDLNPGDLFYYTSPPYKSKTPITQLRFVRCHKEEEPDPALQALVSPSNKDAIPSKHDLDRTVRKVEGEELRKLQVEAKKHKVTDVQRKDAAAMCAIMGHYAGYDLAFAANIMGETLESKTAELARAAQKAQGNKPVWGRTAGLMEKDRWALAADALFRNEMPACWENAGDREL
jgi:hypothetical protein